MDSSEKGTYIIPNNYTDCGRILGIFERQSVITALLWLVPAAFFIFYLLPFSTDVRIITFMFLGMPPAIILLAGIGGEPFIDFIRYYRRFSRNRKIYLYEKGSDYEKYNRKHKKQ